jgi:hypothetical protein
MGSRNGEEGWDDSFGIFSSIFGPNFWSGMSSGPVRSVAELKEEIKRRKSDQVSPSAETEPVLPKVPEPNPPQVSDPAQSELVLGKKT